MCNFYFKEPIDCALTPSSSDSLELTPTHQENDEVQIIYETSKPQLRSLNSMDIALFEYHMLKIEQYFLKFKSQNPEKFQLFTIFAENQKNIYKHVFTND